MTDLVIVGAGLAGLFSSVLAARDGLEVVLVAQGRGGLAISSGCIEIWRQKAPSRAVSHLAKAHPLTLAGKDCLYAALNEFSNLMQEYSYPFVGSVNRNFQLPTALGRLITVNQAPATMAKGEIESGDSFWLAQFPSFRDFYGEIAFQHLKSEKVEIKGIIDLPLFNVPAWREAYAPDLAHKFELADWLEEIIRAWRPKLQGLGKVGLPAVLGFDNAPKIHQRLEDELAIEIFEIPTLPPSVPGLRLEKLLRRAALNAGVNIMEGSAAVGRVDGRTGGTHTSGVVLQTAGGSRQIEAAAVLLATGGLLNGGLIRRRDGIFQESVYDLPLYNDPNNSTCVSQTPLESQPYGSIGVGVDAQMRVLDAHGDPLLRNLYAVGGLIAGSDRTAEGTRQGIDLATAFCAVKAIQS